MKSFYLAGAASLALLLAACGGKDAGNEAAANGAAGNEAAAGAEKGGAEGGHADEGVVTLGSDQIAAAGVFLLGRGRWRGQPRRREYWRNRWF